MKVKFFSAYVTAAIIFAAFAPIAEAGRGYP